VADPEVMSILHAVNPAGRGPDAPLFSDDSMSKLAALPSSEEQLLTVVRDPISDQALRFVAAEALVEGNWTDWRSDSAKRRAVADSLANAIPQDRIHNRWGLPGSFVGPFGERLLSLGAEAEAALVPLLDDTRPLHIVGSEAATLNSQSQFRVSDLAAWLIAASRHSPWQADGTPAERDNAIADLRQQRKIGK